MYTYIHVERERERDLLGQGAPERPDGLDTVRYVRSQTYNMLLDLGPLVQSTPVFSGLVAESYLNQPKPTIL